MPERSYLEVIQDVYRTVMAEDDDVFVMGEDVQTSFFNNTLGLVDEFGEDRVRDTPISEQGFVGTGVGAAMDGKRPIVELQINPLIHLTMEQLVNQAQKIHYMSDGTTSVPLTVTVPMAGAPGASGAQHSDNTYPGLANFGVKSIVPSDPYDLKGMFRSAIYEDDPVVVYFPTKLYRTRAEVPDETYTEPLGDARVKREGEDVTIVAIGETVPPSLSVSDELEGDVDVEVVDLRSALPLDESAVLASVEKTGRVVVTDPTNRTCGLAAEVASRVANKAFWSLEAPVKRVTRADASVAFNPPQENAILPDEEVITEAVTDLV